ncbi:gliding motility-associated C-terminal domain-containing protein [Aureivirga sp. CE67]|uniref:T9SS type B sorting domain-containing protein n=1 Tax=Aureivirga sp. CE67 TaxID=1788983 RepID=UPI0018CBC5CF|nr:gliding motility-associated C-terminal domain-containing protein [Aureivirga sp. CE67]
MKIKITSLFLLYFIFTVSVFAQKESSIWFFGENAGLDFNTNPPTPIVGEMETLEGCTSICTPEGDLLFYSDGIDVWNKNHESMFPIDTPIEDKLGGENSSTSSGMVVPYPNDDTKYFIFTVHTDDTDFEEISTGLKYSTIDMTLNAGLGGVVESEKNIQLLNKCSEKLTATKTSDGTGFWLLTHYENKFYAYKVTSSGVNETPITSEVGPDIELILAPLDNTTINYDDVAVTNMRGYMKFNLQGTKLISAFYSNNKIEDFPALSNDYNNINPPRIAAEIKKGLLYLFDFDKETGIVSNPLSLLSDDDQGSPYGVEFSPNGNYAYAQIDYYTEFENNNGEAVSFYSELGVISQFDLNANDIPASKINIYEKTYNDDLSLQTFERRSRGSLQIAIDGKIYHTTVTDSYKNLSFIEFPNEPGLAANYIEEGLALNSSVKTRWGLPVFIQSIFEPTIKAQFFCLGDETHFYIDNEDVDSVVWNFGDPDSGTNNISTDLETTHIYSDTGTFTVTAEVGIGIQNFSVSIEVTILDSPILDDLPNLESCRNNEDVAVFDFSEVSDFILNSNEQITNIQYYTSLEDLENQENEIENIDNYTTSENQTIYVFVENVSLCNSTGTFELIIIENDFSPDIEDLFVCKPLDDLAKFDLEVVYNQILETFTSETVIISFYETENDLENDENQIQITDNYSIEENSKTIYVKILKGEEQCKDTTSFTLNVYAKIILPKDNIEQCETSYQISEFDLEAFKNSYLEEVDNENIELTFYTSEEDLLNNLNPINLSEVYINESNPEILYIKIFNSETNCETKTTLELIVKECEIPDIEVPNSFNSNSSEGFEIEDLKNYFPDFKLYIYNRYGTLVYEGDKNTENWDGTAKNSDAPLPSGTYYYVLELNRNNMEPRNGWIFLSK